MRVVLMAEGRGGVVVMRPGRGAPGGGQQRRHVACAGCVAPWRTPGKEVLAEPGGTAPTPTQAHVRCAAPFSLRAGPQA